MDVKIRHKLIKIEDRVSDRFVKLITNLINTPSNRDRLAQLGRLAQLTQL